MSEHATVAPSSTPTSWIGQPVKRVEDARLLTGRGAFIDDHPPVAERAPRGDRALAARPRAHPRLRRVGGARHGGRGRRRSPARTSRRLTKPFAVGVTAPVHYYCAATDKARFVGEPVAVVVARNRYLAEDAAEAVVVHYEPLPAVVDVERALEPDAPVLHEAVGSNLAGHRRLVYGDPDRAFAEADVVIRERFRYPKYGSTPIETYGVIARWDPLEGVLHALVELHGAVHHAPAHRAGARRAREQAALHRAAGHRRQLRHQVEHLPLHGADRARRAAAPACR